MKKRRENNGGEREGKREHQRSRDGGPYENKPSYGKYHGVSKQVNHAKMP